MSGKNFAYEEFIQYQNVPRETFLRLQAFTELLQKWQKTINLVSNTAISELWIRHIIDSSQLIEHFDKKDLAIDIGSGAGFPGLVLAIMGAQNMTLVESDMRKVAFLREAARITDTKVTIVNQRIEEITSSSFSVVTARAFAPVLGLLTALEKIIKNTSNLLLLKGKNHQQELHEARKYWSFESQTFPSITDRTGIILSLTRITKNEPPHENAGR